MSIGADKIVRFPFPTDLNYNSRFSRSNFGSLVFEGLYKNSNAVALVNVQSNHQILYGELSKKAELLARHLLLLGCRAGDVVAIFSPNSIEWCIVLVATFRIGAIPAAMDPFLSRDELQQHLIQCRASFVFTVRPLASKVVNIRKSCSKIREVIVQDGPEGCLSFDSMQQVEDGLPVLPSFDRLNIRPDDPCCIFFSSGTTGVQKAVLLSHRNMITGTSVLCHPRSCIVYPRQILFAPFSHANGGLTMISGFVQGFTSFIIIRFDFEKFLATIQQYQISGILIVPPIAVLLAKSPLVDKYELTSLKELVVVAAPFGKDTEDQLMARFQWIRIRQAYGSTESSGILACFPLTDERISNARKPGSVGIPGYGWQFKVVDINTGAALGCNERGEILAKGDMVMLRYLGQPEATVATIDRDGWVHTGDIGYYDSDGYFYIVDRLKELIKYNAYQVAPAELEAILLTHPLVIDAGVIGIPDPTAGELPAAWVVKKPGANPTEKELIDFVAERVSPIKKLRGGVRFVESIPKTASGKILRRIMRSDTPRVKL